MLRKTKHGIQTSNTVRQTRKKFYNKSKGYQCDCINRNYHCENNCLKANVKWGYSQRKECTNYAIGFQNVRTRFCDMNHFKHPMCGACDHRLCFAGLDFYWHKNQNKYTPVRKNKDAKKIPIQDF
jgi:hypothetical protein